MTDFGVSSMIIFVSTSLGLGCAAYISYKWEQWKDTHDRKHMFDDDDAMQRVAKREGLQVDTVELDEVE